MNKLSNVTALPKNHLLDKQGEPSQYIKRFKVIKIDEVVIMKVHIRGAYILLFQLTRQPFRLTNLHFIGCIFIGDYPIFYLLNLQFWLTGCFPHQCSLLDLLYQLGFFGCPINYRLSQCSQVSQINSILCQVSCHIII